MVCVLGKSRESLTLTIQIWLHRPNGDGKKCVMMKAVVSCVGNNNSITYGKWSLLPRVRSLSPTNRLLAMETQGSYTAGVVAERDVLR